MRLTNSIAITMGVITCLSSFLLGLGQEDFILPFLMFIAAALSYYLTDVRRLIRLGDWTVNALILIIVFSTLGEILYNLMNYRNEALAFSIARTLVFVEMVLLFREKEPRFCWQILLISLLQVVVASTMQQSLLFGFLLLVYIFIGLYAFVLIFLRKENIYYRRHSFVNTFLDSLKAEIAARQDHGRLVRIALITLFTGPLSLVFSFSSKQNESKPSDSSDWKLLRSLFAVFPKDDSMQNEHWETILTETESSNAQSSQFESSEKMGSEEKEAKIAVHSNPSQKISIKAFEKKWTSVPRRQFQSKKTLKNDKNADSGSLMIVTNKRFPLLFERPAFSAGTMSTIGLAGGRGELLRHLIWAAFFSLLVAIAVFCFVPRTGKIDFWSFDFTYGNENWGRSALSPVGTVGFSEEIRLGSLGAVIPYHRSVMSVRFMKIPGKQIPNQENLTVSEVPYTEIQGGTLYFRGVALENYANGIWTPQKPFVPPPFEPGRRRNRDEEDSFQKLSQFFQSGFYPGRKAVPGMNEQLFFESGSDLVCLHMNIQPLDTRIFFAPWPFFQGEQETSVQLLLTRGNMHESKRRHHILSTFIYSTAFKHGVQLPIIPCQEPIDQANLLKIPSQRLESLTALAKQWDKNSKLPEDDFSGRALNIEHQFLYSGQFNYQLGGTKRDYSLDPLEDFIGNNPSGHCEYFAGAMALMLRSIDIPARVVVGFKVHADETGNEIQIRQSDAHAWVEVYLPSESLGDRSRGLYSRWWKNGAWLRLDPTPPSMESSVYKNVSFTMNDLMQGIQNGWNDYIVNMNSYKQSELIYEPIGKAIRFVGNRIFNVAFWKEAIPDILRYYRSLFFKGRDTVWGGKDFGLLALPFLIFAVILFLVWCLAKPLFRQFLKRSRENRQRKATIDFYVSMERLLSKIKKRSQGQTPLEYARQFDFESMPEAIVNAYYRVRFGNTVLSVDELQEIRGTLTLLEKQIAQNNEPARS